ncbi:MAG TPA: class I SAM-dependent methyltransferase [Steroidobacteraceae bacterium]|jgi:SAM-dependent methyltransferase|nr:class I SAM-dependent methyltransferase [Steroidobacteraceae bacterium]
MANDSNRDWQLYGEVDPYFGVISLDRFHKNNLTNAALSEFFSSGEQHIQYVLDIVRTHLDPTFRPICALDFGCGVGRCTLPLARLCEQVTGVDVSQAMLEEGQANARKHMLSNIKWLNSSDLSNLNGSFEFVHSFIVFQHIPPARGMPLLARLIDLLAPEGIAAIQVLYHRDVSRLKQLVGRLRVSVPLMHNLANLYYGKPFNYPLMQKNVYDLSAVFDLLQKKQCGSSWVTFAQSDELQSAMMFFRKRPDAMPYYEFYNAAKNAQSA